MQALQLQDTNINYRLMAILEKAYPNWCGSRLTLLNSYDICGKKKENNTLLDAAYSKLPDPSLTMNLCFHMQVTSAMI